MSVTLTGCGSRADSTANKFMTLLVAGKHLQAQEMLSKDMRGMATLLGGVSNASLNPYYRSGASNRSTFLPPKKRAVPCDIRS